jgi:hypothetical protein
MKLGPVAQKLSTFTTPIGKVQWTHGWFGWHSFPAVFQRMIMEKVVLPAMDVVPSSTILAWIDDLIVAAGDSESFSKALLELIDRIVAIGGRLNAAKCGFLIDLFDWCGVEVNLPTSEWRIARHRVQSLREIPIPKDREALTHVLGILRY